jgi:hypothetical protein
VSGKGDARVDNIKNTITVPAPASVKSITEALLPLDGDTLAATDALGNKIKDAELLKSGCYLLTKHSTGGGVSPFSIECKQYSIIDISSPPPAPKPYTPSTRPAQPPKPLMAPASAPAAPDGTVNLVEGKSVTASIDAKRAADLAKPNDANWFAAQRYPQWLSVDLGGLATFDYVSVKVLGPLSLQHFWIQISDDATTWKNLVEVDHVRKNTIWNGYFEKTRTRYIRTVIVPPSSDVHFKKLVIANLEKPLLDEDGKVVTVLKPVFGDSPDFAMLPPAASLETMPGQKTSTHSP